MTEIWKDIPGYEGCYQVSTLGNVRAIRDHYTRIFNGREVTQVLRRRQLSATPTSHGYRTARLTVAGVSKNYKIHRLVALAFIPNPQNLPEVNHINGIRFDNRVENLEWVNRYENITHSKRRSGHTTTTTGIRKRSKKGWSVRVGERSLGVFPTLQKAKAAYQAGIGSNGNKYAV